MATKDQVYSSDGQGASGSPEMDWSKVKDMLGQPVPYQLLPAVQLRIEALRAAARIVVALKNAEQHPDHQFRWAAETTFEVAEQFAAWLETGER